MELRDYLAVLRRYWRSATALLLLGLILAAMFNALSRPTYTAKTALFISVNGGGARPISLKGRPTQPSKWNRTSRWPGLRWFSSR